MTSESRRSRRPRDLSTQPPGFSTSLGWAADLARLTRVDLALIGSLLAPARSSPDAGSGRWWSHGLRWIAVAAAVLTP